MYIRYVCVLRFSFSGSKIETAATPSTPAFQSDLFFAQLIHLLLLANVLCERCYYVVFPPSSEFSTYKFNRLRRCCCCCRRIATIRRVYFIRSESVRGSCLMKRKKCPQEKYREKEKGTHTTYRKYGFDGKNCALFCTRSLALYTRCMLSRFHTSISKGSLFACMPCFFAFTEE